MIHRLETILYKIFLYNSLGKGNNYLKAHSLGIILCKIAQFTYKCYHNRAQFFKLRVQGIKFRKIKRSKNV